MAADSRYSRVDIYESDTREQCLYLFALDIYYHLHCFRYGLPAAQEDHTINGGSDTVSSLQRLWSLPLPFDDTTFFRRDEEEDEGEEEETHSKSSTPLSAEALQSSCQQQIPAYVAKVHCELGIVNADAPLHAEGSQQACAKIGVVWFRKDEDDAQDGMTSMGATASYTPLETSATKAGTSQVMFLEDRREVFASLQIEGGMFQRVYPMRRPNAFPPPSSTSSKKRGATDETQLCVLCKGAIDVVTMLSMEGEPPEQLMRSCKFTVTPYAKRGTQIAKAVSPEARDGERLRPYFFHLYDDAKGELAAAVRRTANEGSDSKEEVDGEVTSSSSTRALLLSFVLTVEGDGFDGLCRLYALDVENASAATRAPPLAAALPSSLKNLLSAGEEGGFCGALVPCGAPTAPGEVLVYLPAAPRTEAGEASTPLIDVAQESEEKEEEVSDDNEYEEENDDDDDDSLQDLDDLYGRAPRRADSYYSYTYSSGSSATHLDPEHISSSAHKTAASSCSQPVISPAPFFSQREDDSSECSSRQSGALVPSMPPLRPPTTNISSSVGGRGDGNGASFFYSFFDDNFEALSFLGKGAGGAVLLARHKLTNQFFAIKVLIVTNYQSEKEVLKEVRVHASLNSYNYNNTSNVGNVVYRRPALLADSAAEAEEKEEAGASGVTADGRNVLQFYNCWSEAVSPDRARQLYEVGILSKTQAGLRRTASLKQADTTWGRFPSTAAGTAATGRGANGAVTLVGEESLSDTETDTDSERETTSEEEQEEEEEEEEEEVEEHPSSLPVCAPGDETGVMNGVCVPYKTPKRGDAVDNDASAANRSFVGSRVVFLQMELCQMTLGRFLAERAVKLNDRYAEQCKTTETSTSAAVPPLFSLYNRIENLIILLQMGKGLLYLHEEKHVLHRDLKPMNVFLDFHCQTALFPSQPAAATAVSLSATDTFSTSTRGLTPSSLSEVARSANNSNRPSPYVVWDGIGPNFAAATTPGEDDAADSHPGCNTLACVALTSPKSPDSSLIPPESTTTPLTNSGTGAHAHAHHEYIYHHAFKGIGLNDKVFTTRMSSGDDSKTNDMESSERFGETEKKSGKYGNVGGGNRVYGNADAAEGEADEERLKADMVNFILNFKYYSVEELLPLCRALHAPYKGTHQQQHQLHTTTWYMEALLKHYTQVRIGDLGLAKMLPLIAPLSDDVRKGGKDKDKNNSMSAAQRPYNFYTAAENMNTEGAGSPMYASPEQLRGHPCTAAADLFSFGMIAVELYLAPTTISERLRVLQDARDGRFEALCRHHHLPPTTDALFGAFPEMRLAAACLNPEPTRRMGLTEFLVHTEDILKECLQAFINAC